MKKLYFTLMISASVFVMTSCQSSKPQPDPTMLSKDYESLDHEESQKTNAAAKQAENPETSKPDDSLQMEGRWDGDSYIYADIVITKPEGWIKASDQEVKALNQTANEGEILLMGVYDPANGNSLLFTEQDVKEVRPLISEVLDAGEDVTLGGLTYKYLKETTDSDITQSTHCYVASRKVENKIAILVFTSASWDSIDDFAVLFPSGD